MAELALEIKYEICDSCRPFFEENGFLDPNEACVNCLRSVETLSKLTTVHETVPDISTVQNINSSDSESCENSFCAFGTNTLLRKRDFAHLRVYSSPSAERQDCVEEVIKDVDIANEKSHRVRKHVCNICRKRFVRATDVKRHVLTHTGERPYVCQLCSAAFKDPSNLRKHSNIHKSNSADFKTYQCGICLKLFSRPSELKRHFFTHTNTRPFSCHICGLAFSDPSNLKKHVHKHSQQSEHSCYDCGLRCNLFEELEQHLRDFHCAENNNEDAALPQQHICGVCFKTFSTETFLHAHSLNHTEIRPHLCTICQKAFKSVAHLKNHALTHQQDKEHLCVLCSRAFLKKSSLKRHMSIHARQNDLITFN